VSAESGQGAPPKLDRVKPPGFAGAGHGLAACEVTAAAALAAGLGWEGPLAENRPLHLYYLAAAAQAQGRLDLATERGHFSLHFRRGGVEHASSDAPEDDLGRYLLAKGALTAEELAEGELARAESGGDLVTALASRQLMNPAESFRVLQEHGAAVLARALGAEKGTARFTPGAPPPPSSFPLGARWGLLCEVVRRLDLLGAIAPFRRCLRCNALLETVRKEDVADELPPRVRERHDAFRRCPSCRRVYWAGTHHRRMEQLVADHLAAPGLRPWT